MINQERLPYASCSRSSNIEEVRTHNGDISLLHKLCHIKAHPGLGCIRQARIKVETSHAIHLSCLDEELCIAMGLP